MSKGGPLLPPLGDLSNLFISHLFFFCLNEEIPVQSAQVKLHDPSSF